MRYILALFFLFTIILTNAQNKADKLKVFLDCSNYNGNYSFDYVRQEMNLITFVRDRMDADAHILAKSNRNSAGTLISTFFIMGKNQYANIQDTLTYDVSANCTEDDARKLFVRNLQIALLPFIAHTTLVNKINISFKTENDEIVDTVTKDPYRNWVFQIGANGNISGTQVFRNASVNGNISADKETATSRTNTYINFNEQYSKYNDNGDIYKYDFQDYSFGIDYNNKRTEHIAIGFGADYTNSIFSNIKSQITAAPKIEYSIFPYKHFNTKRWVVQYGVGVRNNIYYDTTIYLKKREAFLAQDISTIFSITQNWGSVNLGAFWRNLLNDFHKNNLSFSGAISTKIARGLNFAVWGHYSFNRNQINIRKGDASIDQILARNREILSSFDYDLGIGISYRFGSKNNNLIDPACKGLNYSINL